MKGYLEVLFPSLAKIKLPISRDQMMLLMAAVNEIFLGVDIYLAHKLSGTIVFREWIPILFGPIAGVLLLIAGWIVRNLFPYCSRNPAHCPPGGKGFGPAAGMGSSCGWPPGFQPGWITRFHCGLERRSG